MYSLLVAARAEAWDFPPYHLFDVKRYLASTEARIVAQFQNLANPAVLAEICSSPALFMYEKQVGVPGWAGRVTNATIANGSIDILFEVDRSRPITWDDLKPFHYPLGISDPNERETTHWAIKDRDLDAVLSKAFPDADKYVLGLAGERKITFAPNVFKVPAGGVEPDLVAVMMPYAGFAETHEAIKAACKISGHRCVRVDNIWVDSTVIQDVFSLIFHANIVVVDFTGKNANVLYETGVAHTLGKQVVPITQSKSDVPFDLQHHRYLPYLPNREGLAKLTRELAARLKHLGGGL